MKKFLKKIKFLPEEGRLQDLFILGGLFVFVAILIIGLFPGTKTMDVKNQEFFLYAVMTVPLIAALYFIVVSLRRNIYSGESLSASSIRYKMAMAFVFVALLSSLPVVLASNYILNQTLSGIIIEKTTGALGEAVVISKEPVELMRQTLQGELEAVRYQLDAGTSTLLSYDGRVFLRNMYQRKGIAMLTYAARFEERRNTLLLLDGGNEDIRGPITDFFSSTRFEGDTRSGRIERHASRINRISSSPSFTPGTMKISMISIPANSFLNAERPSTTRSGVIAGAGRASAVKTDGVTASREGMTTSHPAAARRTSPRQNRVPLVRSATRYQGYKFFRCRTMAPSPEWSVGSPEPEKVIASN